MSLWLMIILALCVAVMCSGLVAVAVFVLINRAAAAPHSSMTEQKDDDEANGEKS